MEKKGKTGDPAILHSRQMGKGRKQNFFHHRDNIYVDFQFQYSGTFL